MAVISPNRPESRNAFAPAMPTLRLRQICLVAADLEPATGHLKAIFGLEECHRDPNVAKYGLENVLLPVGTDFIEIVAPTREGTAAGRFLARHGGRHGYMIIMDCDDPARRQVHCAALGVRAAHVIRREDYLGVQLHPKDTGGAMLEFNRTAGGEPARGPYAPAGEDWQRAIRTGVVSRMLSAEIECPDPATFSTHWSRIFERPVLQRDDGTRRISLDTGAIDFLPGAGPDAVLAGIALQVVDRKRVMDAAGARGCVDADGHIALCGVRFRLEQ